MKRALVLCGGGAKGAFQFGALKFIHEVVQHSIPGFDYNIIAGVSVGTLNGSMIAMGKYNELKEVWDTVDNDKIYTGKLKMFPALLRIIIGRKSVLGNGPLQDLIAKHVSLNDLIPECDFRLGAVSLISGLYKSFKADEFNTDDDFRNAVLASTVMPIIWEPVKKFQTKNGTLYEHLVDGGVRNVSPLGDIIDDEPDEIIIINCNNQDETPDEKSANSIFTIAKRSLTEIAINEIFRSDVSEFLHINNIIRQLPAGVTVKKSNGQPYKYYKEYLIEPEEDMGDSLDFTQASVQRRIIHGYNMAKKVFSNVFSLPV